MRKLYPEFTDNHERREALFLFVTIASGDRAMKDFNQRDEFYLRTAQLAENLHAELAGRSPVKVDLDQPVSLRIA